MAYFLSGAPTDLRAIQREFSERFNVRIEAYYARLERGEATFEGVGA